MSCSSVPVSLPFSLGWSAGEGGVVDKDGLGTGFTMIQPSTTGGYLPANLDLNTTAPGTLDITTTSGIQFKTPATTGGASNGQHNALGVAFNGTAGPVRLETTLVNPPTGNNQAEQAGLWFGIDEDNYVKLVVASVTPTTQMRVQLAREIAGVSNGTAAGDEVNTGNLTVSASTVRLSLVLDPVTNTASATYRIDGGAPVTVGSFTVPASFFTGIALETGGTPKTFAGIFTTHRNRTATPASLVFRFGDFLLTERPDRPGRPDRARDRDPEHDLGRPRLGRQRRGRPGRLRRVPGGQPRGPVHEDHREPRQRLVVHRRGPDQRHPVRLPGPRPRRLGQRVGRERRGDGPARCGQPAGGDLPGPGQLPVRDRARAGRLHPRLRPELRQRPGLRLGRARRRPPRAAWSATAATGTTPRRPTSASTRSCTCRATTSPTSPTSPCRAPGRSPSPTARTASRSASATPTPGADPTSHELNVEGVKAIDSYVPGTGAARWSAATVSATVSDGRLTIDPIGGTNTKINYVVITPAAPPDTTPPDAPVITTPAGDGYDLDGDLTLAGSAEAGSTVELFDGATSKGTTTATGGTWTHQPDRRRRRRPRVHRQGHRRRAQHLARVGRPDDHRRHRRPDRDRPQPAGRRDRRGRRRDRQRRALGGPRPGDRDRHQRHPRRPARPRSRRASTTTS